MMKLLAVSNPIRYYSLLQESPEKERERRKGEKQYPFHYCMCSFFTLGNTGRLTCHKIKSVLIYACIFHNLCIQESVSY